MSNVPTSIAVVGATGYVGGRLVPRLLERGFHVVAVSRSLAKLRSRSWADHPSVELRAADVLDSPTVVQALQGCSQAVYLVHSMNPATDDFEDADRRAACNLAWAAEQVGLQHVLYLGGLGNPDSALSKHLRSRAEVAEVLASGGVPVTTLRAAMIIGSGSASFEMLRYLVDRLPFMVTPRWVSTRSQPIAIRNVLDYLIGCVENRSVWGQVYDIGGPDTPSYLELMNLYAEAAGLAKRVILPVPVFSPKLSAYWVSLITPIPASLARPLVEGLKNPAICAENRIREHLRVELLSCKEAIIRALRISLQDDVETHWSDAGYLPPEETVYPGDTDWAGGTVYQDRRAIVVACGADELWAHVVRIGGQTGWYYGAALWRLRGIMDTMLGGPGDRRGRRDQDELQVGDALDFWRVLALKPGERMRLLAEMKLPGLALLDFHVEPIGHEHARLTQTAWFVPRGLLGILYWWAVTPLHSFVFSGMLEGVASAAKAEVVEGPLKDSGDRRW